MKVRLAIAIGVFVGLVSGVGSAQALLGHRPAATGDWGCAVVRPINQGICFENPLPERLPLPAAPTVPA